MTEFVRHVALLWLAVGVGGLLFRTVHLFFIKDVQSGLVWLTKIVTDPFHDIMLYHKAPIYLLRGEMIDPGHASTSGSTRMPKRRRGPADFARLTVPPERVEVYAMIALGRRTDAR